MINFLGTSCFPATQQSLPQAKTNCSMTFCCFISRKKPVQLYLLPSLSLLFLSVHIEGPQEAHGGLWRHCVRDLHKGGSSTQRSRVSSWGYCNGEESRDSQFYWSIWDLLRCFVLRSNKSIFILRSPVLISGKAECYSDLDHSLSLLILRQNLTSPPEGRMLSLKGTSDDLLSDPVWEIQGSWNG